MTSAESAVGRALINRSSPKRSDRAVAGGVLVEGDSIVWVAQKLRQGVFAVYFEQVEGGYSPSGQRSNSGSRLTS